MPDPEGSLTTGLTVSHHGPAQTSRAVSLEGNNLAVDMDFDIGQRPDTVNKIAGHRIFEGSSDNNMELPDLGSKEDNRLPRRVPPSDEYDLFTFA